MANSLVILSAVAAEIKKRDSIFSYELGELWPNDNEHALNFVNQIEAKFGRKAKTYGFLNEDVDSNSIPEILKTFNSNSEENFQFLATKMMGRIRSSLNEEGRSATQVGHVVFVHYCNEEEQEDMGRLLAVMVDKKDVFDFGEGLVPKQFKSIDVDTLRQAVMYDLTLFDEVYPEHVAENQDEAYLWFITGKSKSSFFKEALGTDDIIDNTVSVSSIFKAIEDFAKERGLRNTQIRKVEEEVEAHIQSKKGKQVSIASVAKRVVAAFPETADIPNAEDFVSFVNEKEYKISEVFDVTSGQMQKATNIEGKKGMEYFYRVKKSALGGVEDDDKYIRYNPDSKTLYIDIVDPDEHDELLSALPNGG